tara:strand:+ start:232 stop:420 length:189 start_codon:yes stop_codon:yes gene_type:complete
MPVIITPFTHDPDPGGKPRKKAKRQLKDKDKTKTKTKPKPKDDGKSAYWKEHNKRSGNDAKK